MPRSKASELTVVYWRDIPAQVIARQGRTMAKRELENRFITAIDACAMRTGLAETDDYLDQWRKGDPQPCGDDLEAAADAAARDLEENYTKERVKALVEAGGFEQ
ncbi:MAG: virulence factor [Pseudomonadota bacterium]